MDYTMWKSMKNCVGKWCQKLCAFLFAATWAFGEMWVLITLWKPTFCGLTKRRLKSQSFCCWMQFVCTKIKACLGSAVPNLLIIKPRPVWLTENRSSNPRALYMHSCWWRRRSEWSLPPLQWNPASLCLSSNSFLHPVIMSRHSDRRLIVMLHTSEAFVSLKLRFTYKLKHGKAFRKMTKK